MTAPRPPINTALNTSFIPVSADFCPHRYGYRTLYLKLPKQIGWSYRHTDTVFHFCIYTLQNESIELFNQAVAHPQRILKYGA